MLLTTEQIEQKLVLLNQLSVGNNPWQFLQGQLIKTFHFATFDEALSWMNDVAIYIEKFDHHPEWLNIYNKVEVKLMTHQEKGITHLDFDLAQKMQKLA
ncbi:4a-hydroxytetrahydrobiopterin dehydratase [Paraglaciecola aquimarina]|uniref:4a-hydroxytetrahydrobiopterin dehydratase n=1 Tax=Paraglaciecola aquimarina TaxID=1235557 RepID=A0ABU3SXL4_9ALTE|nr:4a-hydroxytetrahydrobiopterin dehydratase [Paraglaciecola aquimarina]MDU0354743.1 4a-hydroxytetrahydrobiopterin dehydratase [Paraglaciecola aquimarina]